MRILMIPDKPHWVSDFMAHHVKNYSRHDITIAYLQDEIPDVNAYDLAYFMINNIMTLSAIDYLRQMKVTTPLVIGVDGWVAFERLNATRLRGIKALLVRSKELAIVVQEKKLDPAIFYCPAGVDHHIFHPAKEKDYTSFKVGWVGNPRQATKMFECVQMLEFKYNMHYAHKINYCHMPKFYHGINCLVSFSRREGGPLPPLEAAACKVPVIVTKTGAAVEWVPIEWQIKAPSESWKLLQQLQSSIELQKKIGQLVYDRVIPNWTWEALVPKWDRTFDSIIEEKFSPSEIIW